MTTTVGERRFHPLREEWVIVAAHRQGRPWSGETVGASSTSALPAFDPGCYLCPGNTRVGGRVNPAYSGPFVFDNDQPALGFARVVCFAPAHNAALATLSGPEVEGVVDVWRRETRDLGQRPGVAHVLVFENNARWWGSRIRIPMGRSTRRASSGRPWRRRWRPSLATPRAAVAVASLDDILAAERADGRRILFDDEHVLAFVPYFARFAYEVYVVPKRRVTHVFHLSDAEVVALAAALRDVTIRFDNLWHQPFPYVQVLHQGPSGRDDGGGGRDRATQAAAPPDAFHVFIAFHPPLRQPRVRKYLAGPEIGGGSFLGDTSPEEKAAELRAVSGAVHYTRATP